MVRKGGLEPPRYCYRQPLKLVRLPIPPLPRAEGEPLRSAFLAYFGAGAGAAGADGAGAADTGAGADGAGAAADGAGVAAGAVGAGAGLAGADCPDNGVRPPTTEPGPRLPRMPSAIAPTMKRIAQTVVARDRTVAPLRAPNAAWLLPPPNALAMSPPLPCCR